MKEEDFLERLRENVTDWDTRRVLADWYEDESLLVLAQGQRWQVEHRKYPRYWPHSLQWVFMQQEFSGNSSLAYQLPDEVFDNLKPTQFLPPAQEYLAVAIYNTLAEAETDLAKALAKVHPSPF